MARKKKNSISKSDRPSISADAIRYQISIRGKGASLLTKEQANELVERRLDNAGTYAHGQQWNVRIKVWRGGQELDWEDDNPRASVLRSNIRRRLHRGEIALRPMGDHA